MWLEHGAKCAEESESLKYFLLILFASLLSSPILEIRGGEGQAKEPRGPRAVVPVSLGSRVCCPQWVGYTEMTIQEVL